MSSAAPSTPASLPAVTVFTVKVLLVDDQALVIEAVRRMLVELPGLEFHGLSNASEALGAALRLQPTVILQDLVMPGVDGFELIRMYRAQPSLNNVPVIVLSARDDPKLKAHSFGVGANDYLVKLPDRLELQARISYHSAGHISRLQRDEAFRFLRESQRQLAAANIELQQLAALDPLTGIANRRRFEQVLSAEWQRSARDQRRLSVLMCDVDCFKQYNDQFGHPAGDLCLKKVAAVLTGQLKRPADLVARYGGEEFVIVLPDTDQAGAQVVAQACLAQLHRQAIAHARADGGSRVTLSIGVASCVPRTEDLPGELIGAADRAMYAAKTGGRDRVVAAASEI